MNTSKLKKSGSFTVTPGACEPFKKGDIVHVDMGQGSDRYIVDEVTVDGYGNITYGVDEEMITKKTHPLARAVMNTITQEEEREEKRQKAKSNRGPVAGGIHRNGRGGNIKRHVQQQRNNTQFPGCRGSR